MGPSSARIIEEMCETLDVGESARILDLGCGTGLTSAYLAKRYGARIIAYDLWISPTDNYGRFREQGVEDLVLPLRGEAHQLPFAEDYFDLIVSVDAYHYFGCDEGYLGKYLLPLAKGKGVIAVAVPGIKNEFVGGIPPELLPFWKADFNFHSCEWWRELWSREEGLAIQGCSELRCHSAAWEDWLACDNAHAIADRAMMKAEGGKYYSLVFIRAAKK